MRFPSSSASRQIVSLFLVSVLLFTYLSVAQAFQPDNTALHFFQLSNRNKTHVFITAEAITQLDKSYFNLLPTQPLTQNMSTALSDIALANADVDTPGFFGGTQFLTSASHFDGENFPGAMRRLVDYKQQVIKLLSLDDVKMARWYLGQALHTLQDFYSHSNWVERGETGIWTALGTSISPFPPRNANTCKDCSRDTCPDDADCDYVPGTNITNLTSNILTTGYYGGEDRNHNFNRFKCDHGGNNIDRFGFHHADTSGTGDKRDGINKDTESCQFSPHWRKHQDAAVFARQATVKYIDDIKQIVGLTKIKRLLGGGPTLAFAIDTTGSMVEEIEAVKAKITDIVNSRVGTPLEASNYVLAPFNDPNVGPITMTADRVKFLQALNDLTANGGGDCPELAYTALDKLVFGRLQDADLVLFTDASAKDVNLVRNVDFFAPANRVRITFVYTGTGSLFDCPISPEYFTTARKSGGKVFEISPSEIQNATILAELMARPNLVAIGNFGGLLNGLTQTFFFRLDTTLTVSTLVVTGTGATNVVIRRPDGTILQPSDFISYVPLSTGLLASISSPVAGLWSISISGSPPGAPMAFNAISPQNPNPNEAGSTNQSLSSEPQTFDSTSSNGEFSVGVFGESERLRFTNFEFIEKPDGGAHLGKIPISSSPPAGQSSLVVGEMVLSGIPSAPQFELRAEDGTILQTFSLEMIDVTSDQVNVAELPRQFIGEITVPTVPFSIYATGLDSNGVPYQRLVSGQVTPQSIQVKPVSIQALYPGLNATYIVEVKNLGPAGSFVVSASDEQGFVTGSPTTVALAQNATANVNVQVQVPASASPGTLDNFSFTAQSTTNPTLSNTRKVGPLRVGDLPQLKLGTVTLTPLGGNGNAFVDPGESGSLSVQLINNSFAELTAISATLTSTSPGVSLTSAQSQYEDMPPDAVLTNTTPFTLDLVSTATCGQVLNFTLTVNYTGGSGQSVFNFSVSTGQPAAATTISYTGPAVAIPDNNVNGVNIPITVSGISGNLSDLNFRFDGSSCSANAGSTTVGLDHTWVGDLIIKLTSPQGTTVTLTDRPGSIFAAAGSRGNNFCNTLLDDSGIETIQAITESGAPYTGTFQPANPLSAFNGQNPNGTWILNVSDRAAADIGNVRAFSLLVSGSQCASVPSTSCTLPAAGSLSISEFRLRGPAGANDEFIELYNTTGASLSVCTRDGSDGWALAASDGTIKAIVPNGTVIPARAHYLVANSNSDPSDTTPRYSLNNYGGTNNATPNATYTQDIEDGAGLALFKSASLFNFTPATRLDAVGFAGVFDTRFREGAGLQPSAGVGDDAEFTFFRKLNTGTHVDTNVNAADFMFVSTTAAVLSGVQSGLGAPGPEKLSSPLIRNIEIPSALIDPAVSAASAPNRVRDLNDTGPNKTFGTISVRRKWTNNLGTPVTLLRFRIVDTTTLFSPGYSPTGGQADVRALSSSAVPVTLTGGAVITVFGTTLDMPPTQLLAGGHNATLKAGTITLTQPLAPGASIYLQFLLGVEKTGSFRFFVNVEAVP